MAHTTNRFREHCRRRTSTYAAGCVSDLSLSGNPGQIRAAAAERLRVYAAYLTSSKSPGFQVLSNHGCNGP